MLRKFAHEADLKQKQQYTGHNADAKASTKLSLSYHNEQKANMTKSGLRTKQLLSKQTALNNNKIS